MCAAAAVMAPHARFVPVGNECNREFLIGKATTIGRVRATEGARQGQWIGRTAFGADGPETEIRFLRNAVTRRCEDDAAAVGGPAADMIGSGVIRKPPGLTTSRGNYVDV